MNYAPNQSQCYVRLPPGGGALELHDLLGAMCTSATGTILPPGGLYLDVGPWQSHVFELAPLRPAR